MTTDKTAIRKVTRKRGAKAQKAPLKSRTISNDLIPIEEETWLLLQISYDYYNSIRNQHQLKYPLH